MLLKTQHIIPNFYFDQGDRGLYPPHALKAESEFDSPCK